MARGMTIGLAFVTAMALILSAPNLYAQPSTNRGWSCPWMGQGGTAGKDGWYCPWAGHKGMWHPSKGQPVTQDQAKQLLEDHLRYTKNPNLKLGDILDKGELYEADVLTKDGSLVDKIQVNKKTGYLRSAYSQ